MEHKASDLLKFQVERRIIALTKKFLAILEDNKDAMLGVEKLLNNMGIEYPVNAEKRYLTQRKQVFDESGECYREIQLIIDKMKNF